jgi:hypothetical protein
MISESSPDRPDAQRLRHHPDDLFALVGATAEHLGLDPAFVEKDYWVTELLRSLGQPLPDNSGGPNVTAVFKGGTSLSKVYRLVDRFSEDVDILLVCEGVGTGQRDRVLKYLCERVGADLDLDSDACRLSASTRGVKRNVRYHYPRRMPSPVITEGVLLEMGVRGGPEPNAVHALRSLIADHGIEVVGDSPDTWAEYAPVEVAVLGAERTLVEKLSLLHGRALRLDDEPEALIGAGRHYYDVYRLLVSPDVRRRLESLPGGVAALAEDIEARSQAAGLPSGPRPTGGFAISPAFSRNSPAGEEGHAAYQTAAGLIWGEIPTFDDCLGAVQEFAELL